MNTQAPLPSGRYVVVQSKEQIEDRVYEALRRHSMTKVDLVSELGSHEIHFRVRTTDHGVGEDKGSYIYGLTTDCRTINIDLPENGEVSATIGE